VTWFIANCRPSNRSGIGWKFPLMELRPDLSPDAMKKAKAGRRPAHDPKKLLAAIAETTAENPISIAKWAKAIPIPRQTLTDYLPELRVRDGLLQPERAAKHGNASLTKAEKYSRKQGDNYKLPTAENVFPAISGKWA